MEKRAFKRLSVDLQARVLFGNIIYTGKVSDLSENGMFINTKINFPLETLLLTVVLLENETLNIPVKIKRVVKATEHTGNNSRSGLGVKIQGPQQDYLDYVQSCNSPE